jgi:catechol 2,3-dioxygenase-like lactoylglutathione lyase family enzyme
MMFAWCNGLFWATADLDASIDWYTRFFGRPPDMRAGEEMLWDIDEHATLFIEPNAARAGAGRSLIPGLGPQHPDADTPPDHHRPAR